MKVLLVEPFFGGAHAQWAERLEQFTRHEFLTLSLEGRYWKWRMRGGSVLLARRYLAEGMAPDLILASSMLDLPSFIAFLAKAGVKVPPIVLYCHENQLLYPVPDDRAAFKEQRNEFGGINWRSTLLADLTIFNSEFHRREALKAYEDFLDRAPDHREHGVHNGIRERTRVFPPAPDLHELDRRGSGEERGRKERPVLLWNHRWEAEKGPARFASMIRSLMEEGWDFDLILTGPSGNAEGVRQKLADDARDRILLARELKDRNEYIEQLRSADLSLITSDQDFFGLSVVEAMYAGIVPIMPERLAYPEHLPPSLGKKLLYRSEEEALMIARDLLKEGGGDLPEQVRAAVASYDIRNWSERFDDELERVAAGELG